MTQFRAYPTFFLQEVEGAVRVNKDEGDIKLTFKNSVQGLKLTSVRIAWHTYFCTYSLSL